MSTAISVLGGVGLFLIGMTVMTEGLKALAGSALRTVLGKAAATPLRGSIWGAIITLLVQSSSATTMTTIGLVSAGLLTFQQGLGLVFGANVGTTGTGWLVLLLPLIDPFTRLVERILPERGSPLTRCLDPSALATPIVAVEAVRRTIARALVALCGSVEDALAAASRGEPVHPEKDAVSVPEAAEALRQAQIFLSDVTGPPSSNDEQRRLTSTLHALDHASRLAEAASGGIDFETIHGGPDDARAGQLCAEAMRSTGFVAGEVAAPHDIIQSARAAPALPDAASNPATVSTAEALVQLERRALELEELQRNYRSETLGAVANGTLTADAAIVRVDTLRSLQALAYHAWRSVAHLVGCGE